MYEKLEVCPVCKHASFSNYLICTDHSVSGESFALSKCDNCELVFTNPRPDENSIGKYYEDINYISHSNKSNNLINFVYKIVRKYTLAKKVRLIKRYTNGKNILDYGCGTGEFLYQCQKNGFETIGYEPNQGAKLQTQKKGIRTINDLKDPKSEYDVITAWHVIEHVQDLRETVKTLKSKLKKDGVLVIAVPNLNSFDSHHYKEFWAALDVPRHLYHFTKTTFGKLVDVCNLKLVRTIPMKFDSFYVSLLSEKYKTKKSNIFSAIKVGIMSNSRARKSGEYSSLIYILKK